MSDFITSGINSYQYTSQSQTASGLQNTLSGDLSTASADKLLEVCKDFESYFVEQVMKSMLKTIPESENSVLSSSYVDMFKDNLIEEYAGLVTDSDNGKGLGLAQILYEQMKINYGITDAASTEDNKEAAEAAASVMAEDIVE